jgi:hypothetical protein
MKYTPLMKTQTAVHVLSILLLLAPAAMPGFAASFSAELVDTRGGQTTTGTFNYQDKGCRLELGEKDRQLLVIVDGQTGVTRLLSPPEKTYVEAGPGEPMSLFANPFAAYAHFAKTKTVRTEGTDSVGGVPCKKQVVFSGEQVFLNAWVSDEFDVPLKVEIPVYGLTVELKNIKRGPQDPALFALPADYHLTVVKEEPEPQPEWVGQVAGAPVLAVPFEKTLAEGEIVRMRPQAGRWLEIEGTNAGQGEGSFTSVPFKGGKSLGPGEMNTTILDPGQSGAMTVGVEPDKADEMIVRVGKGTIKIKTAFVAPAPRRTGPRVPAAEEPAAPDVTAAVNAPNSAEIATQILIEWMGAGKPDDFISVARSDQPPGASINRTFVREGNPLKLWMPSDPGEYEVRYILGHGSKLLAKAPITVTAVPAKVEPAGPVNAAAWIEVKWEGPARDGDYISVAGPGQASGASIGRTPVKEGNPLKVRAPSDPGDYEVRYVLARGAKLLAKAPITVNPVTAEVKSPASAAAGAEFEVQWQGPGYPEDFVSVARANQPPGAHVNFVSVRKGSPLKLRAPKEPGTYEVRYVLGRGKRLLAKTTITIKAP